MHPVADSGRSSVGDIAAYTAPDLHVYNAGNYSAHASLVRDYLD